MAYYMVRLYSGSSDRSPEQVLRDVNPKILPKLQEAGGLIRFLTFVNDDGRIGSASVYEDREAAQRGLQIGRDVAGVAEAMQGYQLSQTLQGARLLGRVCHHGRLALLAQCRAAQGR